MDNLCPVIRGYSVVIAGFEAITCASNELSLAYKRLWAIRTGFCPKTFIRGVSSNPPSDRQVKKKLRSKLIALSSEFHESDMGEEMQG
jgi:hypothetical protein